MPAMAGAQTPPGAEQKVRQHSPPAWLHCALVAQLVPPIEVEEEVEEEVVVHVVVVVVVADVVVPDEDELVVLLDEVEVVDVDPEVDVVVVVPPPAPPAPPAPPSSLPPPLGNSSGCISRFAAHRGKKEQSNSDHLEIWA